MKWLAALVAAVLVALLVWPRRPPIPSVREIQAQALSYADLVDILSRHPRVSKPDSYAAFLYRRAYGRNPDAVTPRRREGGVA